MRPNLPHPVQFADCLDAATRAARDAGDAMRRHLNRPKKVHSATRHDIKLELDVQCQHRIARILKPAFPDAAFLGEEGTEGNPDSPWRWVVDPIDGTVNFTHGVPHACVSIALQSRSETAPAFSPDGAAYADGFATRLGVVFDPFTDELWTATDRGPARLNGRPIRVATTTRLSASVVALGFAKSRASLERMLPLFQHLVHRVRKIRIMGAAALSLTYVASGRFDAYVESGVRLWDIAAGGLLVQRAGGVFWRRELADRSGYAMLVGPAPLQRALRRLPNAATP